VEYWKGYIDQYTPAVIYMIDSADKDLFYKSKKALFKMIEVISH
jgi:hypothetical protein